MEPKVICVLLVVFLLALSTQAQGQTDRFCPFATDAPEASLLGFLVFSLMAHSQEHLRAHVIGRDLSPSSAPPLQDRNREAVPDAPPIPLPQPVESVFSEP